MKYLLQGEESERLYFTKVSQNDYKAWVEFFDDPKTREHWIADFKDARTECNNWYERQAHRYKNDLGGMNALRDKKSKVLVGHCGLLLQNVGGIEALEIGYSLLPEFWNQGFATEAALKCRNHAFEHNWCQSLISIISLSNIPSQKVALKNGMRICHQTRYKDNEVHIFRIDKKDWINIVSDKN